MQRPKKTTSFPTSLENSRVMTCELLATYLSPIHTMRLKHASLPTG